MSTFLGHAPVRKVGESCVADYFAVVGLGNQPKVRNGVCRWVPLHGAGSQGSEEPWRESVSGRRIAERYVRTKADSPHASRDTTLTYPPTHTPAHPHAHTYT